jgi:hypothetical protein
MVRGVWLREEEIEDTAAPESGSGQESRLKLPSTQITSQRLLRSVALVGSISQRCVHFFPSLYTPVKRISA